jgi:thioredoxin reductase (NADPH)
MNPPRSVVPLAPSLRADQVFPTLSPEQIARVAARGRARAVASGEVLQSAGQPAAPFFLVTRGSVEVVRRTAAAEEVVTALKAGQFTARAHDLRAAGGREPGGRGAG